MKYIITILITVVAVLGVQAARTTYVNRMTVDPSPDWTFPPCIEWKRTTFFSDQSWSFSGTRFECIKQEMALDAGVDRFFNPDDHERNSLYCDISNNEVALLNEDNSFYGCMEW